MAELIDKYVGNNATYKIYNSGELTIKKLGYDTININFNAIKKDSSKVVHGNGYDEYFLRFEGYLVIIRKTDDIPSIEIIHDETSNSNIAYDIEDDLDEDFFEIMLDELSFYIIGVHVEQNNNRTNNNRTNNNRTNNNRTNNNRTNDNRTNNNRTNNNRNNNPSGPSSPIAPINSNNSGDPNTNAINGDPEPPQGGRRRRRVRKTKKRRVSKKKMTRRR